MPRPKRSKVAPSAPTPVFPWSKQATKTALPSYLSSPKSQATSNSDDSEGLVKRNKSGRNSRGVPRYEVHMSGALPSSDEPSTRQKPISGREREELSRIARQSAKSQAKGNTTAAKATQDSSEAPEVQVPASNPENVETIVPRNTQLRSSPRQNAPGSALKRPASSAGLNWRTQATPQADSSILSLANFKRRPRKPSILGIGQPDDSLTLSSLGGLEGEENLLGHDEPSRSKALDFTIMDEQSDFEPDNESTPFDAAKAATSKTTAPRSRLSRARSIEASSPVGTPAASRHVGEHESPGSEFESQLGKKLRMNSTPATKSSSFIGTRKRKITPPEVQVPQSQNSVHSIPASDANNDGFDVADEESASEEPELPAPKRRASPQPEEWNEYMAPPKSSSPGPSQPSPANIALSSAKTAPTRGRGRPKRNQPARGAASKAKTKHTPSKPLSTAALQSYLPRRHTTKHYGEFEIHSDSSVPAPPDDDEDELSYMGPGRRKTARTAPSAKAKRNTLAPSKTPKTNARSKATAASTAKSKAKTTSKDVESVKPKRTYGRRDSGKENEPTSVSSAEGDQSNDSLMAAPEESSTTEDTSMELPGEAKKELQKLRKKFEEVDDWKMEFEEITASSSSPKDAR